MNYKSTSLIILLILSLSYCTAIKKNKVYENKPYSIIGHAKLKLYKNNKISSCKMNYCYQKDKRRFISEFVGPFYNKLGYFILSSETMFFAIKNLNIYSKARADKNNFSHLIGIEIDPFSFLGLLEGKFNFQDFNFYEAAESNEFIINYFYSGTESKIAEILDKKSKNIKSLFFYQNGELYSSIKFSYNKYKRFPVEISIKINPIHSFIIINIEGQRKENYFECYLPEEKFLKEGNEVSIEEYNKNYPMIFDLVE